MQREVRVHKANVPLAKGESLGQYTRKLEDAARKHLFQKLNLGQKCWVYMVEVYKDSAIADVYKASSAIDMPGKYSYYAMKYTRSANGEFEFSSVTEVERVVSFEPKTMMTVAKSAHQDHRALDGGPVEQNVFKSAPESHTAPGWVVTAKHIWNGVL
mgnify:CR=1 FL=1